MKFKSAPAPWRYAGGGVIHDANDNFAIYLAGRLNDGTADDVGHMIAAAPDLYEALRLYVATFDETDHHPTRFEEQRLSKAARAALAKAAP